MYVCTAYHVDHCLVFGGAGVASGEEEEDWGGGQASVHHSRSLKCVVHIPMG